MHKVAQTRITEVTRRDIRRALAREGISWCGDLHDVEFLSRLYDLKSLPSHDGRFEDMEGDIVQHRYNNADWDDSWIFSDDRLQLADGPDHVYVEFLAEMVHPVVRSDRGEASRLVSMLNELLAPDGWSLVERDSISGRPIYGPASLGTSQHAIEAAKSVASVFNADFIHAQVTRMTSAIESDPSLAIGTAKELVESCCLTILSIRGVSCADKPEILPLVRRTLEHLRLLPAGISDELEGAKTIKSLLGNLAVIAQSLAELRNRYGTGHGREGTRKGLAGRHARLAVGAATTLVWFLFETHEERAG